MDVVVRNSRVGGNSVIPEGDCAVIPADSDLEILSLGYMLAQRELKSQEAAGK
jgi:hypothetical protein